MKISWIKKNFPNFLTITSLFWGFSSILASIQTINELYANAINGNLTTESRPEVFLGFAGLCIIFATVFDFLDGFFARWFKVESKLGKELDSLSDLVSFGIAPGVLFYTITLIAGDHIPGTGIYYTAQGFVSDMILPNLFFLKILAFVFPTCAIIRLATFNLKKKTNYYLGIPSTYAGGLAALVLTFNFYLTPINRIYFSLFKEEIPVIFPYLLDPLKGFFSNYFFIVFIYLSLSFLMISKFKFYKLTVFLFWIKSKKYILVAIIISLLILLLFKYMAVALCLIYFIASMIINFVDIKKIKKTT